MYRRLLRLSARTVSNLALAVVLLWSRPRWAGGPAIVQRVPTGSRRGLLDPLVVVLIVVLLITRCRRRRPPVSSGVGPGEKVIFDLRMAIVNHLQSMSLSFFNVRTDRRSYVTRDERRDLVHGVVTQTISRCSAGPHARRRHHDHLPMNWRLAPAHPRRRAPIASLGRPWPSHSRHLARGAGRSG